MGEQASGGGAATTGEVPGATVGVGPWPGPWPTRADGSPDPRYDPTLLRDGDRRNVEDRFRYLTMEAIVAALDETRHELHVAVENWEHDLNIGSVIRTANAFNVAAFHVVGRRRWNRRGAMVTDRYQHEIHHPDVADLVGWCRAQEGDEVPGGRPGIRPGAGPGQGGGMPLIAVDNVPGSVPLETFELPRRCVLAFGQEGPGLTRELLDAADSVVHITQFGSTRSINAGAAAAIAMHAWVRRHAFGPTGGRGISLADEGRSM
ncbi:RNA methyltransferase [Arsenicicoccus sp. MKL-02]|uniref:RNA methyltransferase n=1 Tax=Arsenicicoccus cauae TaxID=2663847 RepID=A0A6I3IR66_9MICO|nr:TrmH family RNA methyltransferase [Arsenicicoccus cauae]MTB72440.1 RNA methyltransferase [Arsenicicoccus cauae]